MIIWPDLICFVKNKYEKYLLIGLLAGLTIGITGCATYVGPVPVAYVGTSSVEVGVVAIEPDPFIFFYGPYYGPIWNGYYWNAERHCYYRPHDGWHGPIGHGPSPTFHGPVGHPQGPGHGNQGGHGHP